MTLNLPTSSKYDFALYNYTTGVHMDLVVSGTEFIDASQNKIIAHVNFTKGNLNISSVMLLDFTNKVITNYFPSFKYCSKEALSVNIDLPSMFEKFNDPNSGVV